MNIFRRVREAAKRFAEAVQERAREVVERAKERFRKEEKEPKPFTFSDLQDYLSEQEPVEFPEELFENEPEEESLSEKLKREDLEKRIKQHEDAYETFKQNYYEGDEEFTREAYDLMWDTIGAVSNEFSERVPSPPMIELYEDMRYKFGADLTKDYAIKSNSSLISSTVRFSSLTKKQSILLRLPPKRFFLASCIVIRAYSARVTLAMYMWVFPSPLFLK